MKKKDDIKIYVDTNVLIDFFTGQKKVEDAMRYLFKQRHKEVLFTSSLAITQMICNLQTKKKNRNAFTKTEVNDIIDYLNTKFTIIDLTFKDITNAKVENGEDMEDCIHYILSKKKKCDIIITSNLSDFTDFDQVSVIKPDIRVLKASID